MIFNPPEALSCAFIFLACGSSQSHKLRYKISLEKFFEA
jgi:hypothetical protein